MKYLICILIVMFSIGCKTTTNDFNHGCETYKENLAKSILSSPIGAWNIYGTTMGNNTIFRKTIYAMGKDFDVQLRGNGYIFVGNMHIKFGHKYNKLLEEYNNRVDRSYECTLLFK